MEKEIGLSLKLQEAYILLKKSFYYENNSLLHIKFQITKFEAENKLLDKQNREIFFYDLAENINNKVFINELLNKISYKKL